MVRKGGLQRKERHAFFPSYKDIIETSRCRAYCPFVFLPPSSPPPSLPRLPTAVSTQGMEDHSDVWDCDDASVYLRNSVFSSTGQAVLTLWIPHVNSFPRLMRIPFILCLALQTRHVKATSATQPPRDILPPAAQLDKATLHLRLKIRSCARRGVQCHIKLLDENATDNFLHGITPEEGSWTLKNEGTEAWWVKEFRWGGLWTIREAPNFANRQLTWTVCTPVMIRSSMLNLDFSVRPRC